MHVGVAIMASDNCTRMGFILRIVAQLFLYVRFIVPILLIVMVVFDLVKVVVGQADEKAKKEVGTKVTKRLIYALIVFLVPTLVNYVFKIVENNLTKNGSATNWVSCWTQYYK